MTGGSHICETVHVSAVIINFMTRSHNLVIKDVRAEDTIAPVRLRLLPLLDALSDCLASHDNLIRQIKAARLVDVPLGHLHPTGRELTKKLLRVIRAMLDWEQTVLQQCRERLGSSSQVSNLADCCMGFGFGLFNTVNLFWAACLIAQATVQAVSLQLDSLSPSTCKIASPYPIWMSSRPYATNIARHAHNWYLSSAGIWGAEAGAFALGCVQTFCMAYNLEHSEEMEMVTKAIGADKHGYATMSFLKSVSASIPASGKGSTGTLREHRWTSKEWFGLTPEVLGQHS